VTASRVAQYASRMARPLRIEFENALYHLTSRGNRRERIFVDDTDRHALLDTVGDGAERFDFAVLAYCLMDNHYHLVLQTRRANLGQLMRHVNGTYAQTYNRRHATTGHLFQGRFNAILVQHDAYFLAVCRYVDLNPVRAGLVGRPGDWPWSSYRAHAGSVPRPQWLDSDLLHRSLAPQGDHEEGAAAYVRYVCEGPNDRLWDHRLVGQIYLGDANFVHEVRKKAADVPDQREIPRVQRQPQRLPLRHYLEHADQDAAIVRAYLEGGYTQAVIALATGASPSRISRLIARQRARSKT
jgi:REP element-mobilizing transposase RayT